MSCVEQHIDLEHSKGQRIDEEVLSQNFLTEMTDPFVALTVVEAPARMSSSMMSILPLVIASCNAVAPSLFVASSFALCSAVRNRMKFKRIWMMLLLFCTDQRQPGKELFPRGNEWRSSPRKTYCIDIAPYPYSRRSQPSVKECSCSLDNPINSPQHQPLPIDSLGRHFQAQKAERKHLTFDSSRTCQGGYPCPCLLVILLIVFVTSSHVSRQITCFSKIYFSKENLFFRKGQSSWQNICFHGIMSVCLSGCSDENSQVSLSSTWCLDTGSGRSAFHTRSDWCCWPEQPQASPTGEEWDPGCPPPCQSF